MPLAPSDLTYGYVRGRYILAVGDTTSDVDRLPDARPASGSVRFRWLGPALVASQPVSTAVVPLVVDASIDPVTGDLLDEAGALGVWLVTGRYEVTFRFVGVTVPTFEIAVEQQHTEQAPLELPAQAPLQPAPGQRFIVNEQIYLDTLAARDEAIAAAGTVTLPADGMTASFVRSPTSETSSALSATFLAKAARGVALGVAGLDSTSVVPLSQLPAILRTTNARPPVGKDELMLNARDYDVKSDGTDSTLALQVLIDRVGSTGGGLIVFPPGSYRLNSVTVKAGVHLVGLGSPGSVFSIGAGNGLANTVNFVHVQNNTGAMLRIAGGGISLSNIALRGNNYAATGFPLMHILDGFELSLAHILFLSKRGTVLLIDHMNNNHFLNVKVSDCTSADGDAAVVVRGPTEPGFNAGENNTLDFAGFTIERFIGGPQFDIAYGTTGNYWAEFVRILHLHVEADASAWPAGTTNADTALVRIGNVMGLELVSPFIFGGGPVPLVLVQRQMTRAGAPLDMGVRFIGGQILGTKTESGFTATPTLVNLRTGNDVAFIGTQFGRCTYAAIVIQSAFGSNVTVDPSTTLATAAAAGVPLVIDNRPAGTFRTWTHQGTLRSTRDVIVGRHIKGPLSLGVGAVTVGGNAGAGGTITVSGTDLAGQITITTGTAPSAGGIGEIAFSTMYDRTPYVQISAGDRATAALRPYGAAKVDGTGWTFGLDGAPAASTTYRVTYQVLG